MAVSTEGSLPGTLHALLAPGRSCSPLPASLPRAQPLCLSWAELGTLTEVPQACYQMIHPRTRTHCPPPWTLQGPSFSPGMPSSAKEAGVEVRTAPLSSWHRGSFQCHASTKPEHGSPWESRTRGPAAAIPDSSGCAQRAAHGPGAHPGHGSAQPWGWASFGCSQPGAWLVGVIPIGYGWPPGTARTCARPP